MDKNALRAFFALAMLHALPAAFAGIVPVPAIVHSELKCGNCTSARGQDCRTLYRTDYYSNGAVSYSKQVAPQTDYTYCHNGEFVKIKFKESYKCSGSTSYKSLDSTGLPSNFKWKYGMDWPTYCPNGCSQATGKCKSTTAQIREIDPNNPQLGPNEPPLLTPVRTLMPKPATAKKETYKWQCSGSPFDGYFRVKVKTSGLWTYTGIKEYCKYGCLDGKCTSAPAAKPTPVPAKKYCTPKNYRVCKNGDVYMKYVYSDCTQAEFLYTDCGSCQTCQNGACKGQTGSTAGKTKKKTTSPVSTSNYGPVYGNNNPGKGQCTYNSECGIGYECDTSNRNNHVCRKTRGG